MADVPSAAQALFPNLPSEAAVADRAPPPDRLGAASIYGSPEGGLPRARQMMDAGVAQPGDAPGKPPPANWLREVADRDNDVDRGETHTTAAFEPKDVGLEPSDLAYDFTALASEMKLTRGQAREFAEIHQAALSQESQRYWSGVERSWDAASRSQFGERLEGMVNTIQPVLNGQLTTPGFRQLLETYKLGSNPDVIQTLHRYALAIL